MTRRLRSAAARAGARRLWTAVALAGALAACRETPPAAPDAGPPAAPAASIPVPAPAAVSSPAPAAGQSATTAASGVPQGGVLPAAVAPFPTGLSGTLVFQSDVEGRPKIYAIDLATGRVRRLTTDPQYRDENPRWSPDGTRILFRSNRARYQPGAAAGEPNYDLYVMQADGSGVRRLTTGPANENEASWHPDGRSVIFSSDRDSRGDLYRLWLADGRVDRLTRHFVGRAIMPAVSPDGTRVAFAAQTLKAGQFWLYQVHVLDLATGRSSAVDSAGGSCWPAWAPDSGSLACVLLDREPSALERVPLAGGSRQPLVAHKTLWSYYPDFSVDGRWIAFATSPAHHDGENWDLAVMAADRPGTFTPITIGPGNDRLPDWKP
jgi:Tol biopolymer transport system component